MTALNVTMPTAEESAALREANPSKQTSYGPAPEGYVKGTEVARTLNDLLKAAGYEHRAVKSQMVYNYIKKGVGGLKTDQYPHVPVAVAENFIRIQFARRTA
jgi:hypothetical protein